jgi:autotransporter-associated beta strand protein
MQKIITRLLLRRVLAGAALVVLHAAAITPPAMAQNDYYWTGANSQPGVINDATHWSNPYNWNPAAFIPSDPSTDLQFYGTPTGISINDLGTFVLRSMSFYPSSNAYAVSGNPLNFQGAALSGIYSFSSVHLALTVSNNLTLNASSPFTLSGPAFDVTLSGAISGTGSLSVNGGTSASLFNHSNTYTGGTIVRGGTLFSVLGLPVGRDVTIQSGTLVTSYDSIGNLTLSDPTTTISSAAPVVSLLSGSSLTLGGNVTYNPSSSSPGASITDGTLSLAAGAHTFNIPPGNGSSYDMVINAPIAGSGGLTKTGNGSLALNQPSTYSGPTTVSSGSLYLGVTNAVQSAVVVNGGQLSLAPIYGAQGVAIGEYDQSIGSLAGSSGGYVNLSAATLTVGTDNTNTSYAGYLAGGFDTITGKLGTLIKVGTGTLTLSQSALVFSLPSITVNGGVLAIVDDDSLGFAGHGYPLTVNNAGTLRYAANASSGRTFSLNGGTVEAAAGTTLTLNGATINGGFLRGTGTFSLTGGTQLFGATTLNSAAVSVVGSATLTNFTNGGGLTTTAGKVLNWNGGTNASSGAITINGAINVTDFTSNGQITVHASSGFFNVTSNLVLGGGSRTTVDSGGLLQTGGGTTIELNGGLLVNNGNVTGTTDVNFGSLAKGTGTYGLVNVSQGGIFAPGNSPGIVTAAAVDFDNSPVSSGAPTLQIELAGTTPGSQYDQLHVTGLLSLGGALNVVLDSPFVPAAGNSFDILDWGTLAGTFSSISLPSLTGGHTWNTSQLYTTGVLSVVAPGIPGDYNNNGIVDAADYTVWRDHLGQTFALLNRSAANTGLISTADYDVWKSDFGNHSGSGAGATAGVPEPPSLLLIAIGFSLLRSATHSSLGVPHRIRNLS